MASGLKERIQETVRRIVYPKGSTALRWKELLILFFDLMCTAMSITMLFPFLPAMVKHFGKTEEETGYYAGLIASSMFFGRFLASYFWGYLADKFGRRPMLIISLFLLSVNMVAFGLSTSVVMAMLTRFGVGLSSGLLGIAKAIISELCDSTNQSLGMSTLTSAYSTGLVVGPGVGGFLSEVGRKYPHLFPEGSFFARFPFLLPCLVNSVLLIIAMIITYIRLPETMARKTQRADSTKKEKVQEESKSFLMSSMEKKNTEGVSVKTKNNTQVSEKSTIPSTGAGNEIKDAGTDVCDRDLRDTKDQSSDKDTIETKEIPQVSHRKQDVHDSNPVSKSLDANEKDGLCKLDDSTHSKDSEQLPDSDISVECEAKEVDKGTCAVGETGCPEKDEAFSRECEVEESALNNEEQTIHEDDNEGVSKTETMNGNLPHSNDENEKKIKSQSCETSTKDHASTSEPCSSTKDSKKRSNTSEKNPSPWSLLCSCCGKTKDSNLWRILRNFNAVLTLIVYSLFSLCVIGADELFNIWGATNPRLGGLDFSTDDLGTAILVVGVAMILIQPTVLPKLERKLGAVLNFQICVMIVIFCIVTQPTLRTLLNRPSVLWPVLLIHTTVMRISISGAFLSCFLFVNNSVRQELLCSVNGLAVSVCSLFRAFAPSVGGSLFAWSISSGYKLGFPFNVNLTFIFFGFMYLVTSSLSCFLSESLNEPKGPKKEKPLCLSTENLLEAKA